MNINVKVIPNSSKEEIIKISDNEYKVYLKKPAVDNKANLELVKIMKKYFKNSDNMSSNSDNDFSNIKIIKGFTSKNKVLEIY